MTKEKIDQITETDLDMIKSVAEIKKGYFQKSTFLLYPTLGVNTAPAATHIRGHGITEKDKILMVQYNEKMNQFDVFHQRVLLQHKWLLHVGTESEKMVYLFDMSFLKDDWNYFLKGKYSKMYEQVKKHTRGYYNRQHPDYFYSESYLDPERFMPFYSQLLWDYKEQDIGLEILQRVGELCDKPDLEKETLILNECPNLKFPKRTSTFAIK